MLELSRYAGKPLSVDQKEILQLAVDQGCSLRLERGRRPCTISVIGDGIKLCYINSSVIGDGALVGYTFRPEDGLKNINGCPPQLIQATLLRLKRRFGNEHGWKLFPIDGPQRKGNIWYRYLHVMDFKLAKEVCTFIA